MKKIFSLLFLLTATISVLAQSEQSLRDYLRENANTLNPIEGVYDVEFYCDIITPFVHQKLGPSNFQMIIIKNGDNVFDVYIITNNGCEKYSTLKIAQIGQTNVYYL